jgi:adenylate cyclase, class 2
VPTEYEAKILDVDPLELTERIQDKGGRYVGRTLMRRHVYDIVPGDQSRWIRLRDQGDRVTLAVKQIVTEDIDGTDEIEVEVSDFDTTSVLLLRLGFVPKSYQENRRTSFVLGTTELEIDEWPRIPPYLEIEGRSREDVLATAHLLGFDEADLTGENTTKVYSRYGIDLTLINNLTFEATLEPQARGSTETPA